LKNRHKILWLFTRFNWWLGLTEKAKEHKKALENFNQLFEFYKNKQEKYLEEHRKNLDKNQVLILKTQVELLATILDIKH